MIIVRFLTFINEVQNYYLEVDSNMLEIQHVNTRETSKNKTA